MKRWQLFALAALAVFVFWRWSVAKAAGVDLVSALVHPLAGASALQVAIFGGVPR